jgi:hypothetical protein
MDIIKKDRNQIFYNPKNTIIQEHDAADALCSQADEEPAAGDG